MKNTLNVGIVYFFFIEIFREGDIFGLVVFKCISEINAFLKD